MCDIDNECQPMEFRPVVVVIAEIHSFLGEETHCSMFEYFEFEFAV